MKRILSSFLDIRKGEGTLVLLMFSYYYLVLLAYYFLKPARDSLFLTRLGSDQLPLVYVLIALIVAPVTTIYSRAASSLRLTRLLGATTSILIASFVLLRFLMELDHPWVYYIFYIWVSIYAILATSQFWLFANEVFNPAQAKRLFPFLNLGGIIGAATGGEVTSLVVQGLGLPTKNLLFFCIGILAICIVLLNLAWAVKQKEGESRAARAPIQEAPSETVGQLFGMIRRSRLLLCIMGIISMTMIVATFVDFQFKVVSQQAFPVEEDLTSFLGRFYGRLSLVSLLLQSLFAYRFLRILGVGGVILFLPASLLFGSVGMLVVPGLWVGVLLKGAEGSFRYSIDKTGRELLFLPVPPAVKRRTKVFIDMFMDRFFRGIAGALLLLSTVVFDFNVRQISMVVLPLLVAWVLFMFMDRFFRGIAGALLLLSTVVFDFNVRQISMVVLPLLVAWVLFTLLVRKEYVNSFRNALEKREIDLSELRTDITDPSAVNSLLEALKSTNERLVVDALNMLASVKDVKLMAPLRPLLNHPASQVRRKAIRLLHTQGNGSLVPEMEKRLSDEDPEVRLEATYFLCRHAEGDHSLRLQGYLKDPDIRIQSAAVGCIARYGDPEEKNLIDEAVIQSLIDRKGKEGEVSRALAAKVLGFLNRPALRTYLLKLADDPSPAVIRQVIESAGRAKDRQFVPWLLAHLSDKQHRADARSALAAYGNRILGTLVDYLTDETVDLSVRVNIPRVFSQIPNQSSVDLLSAHIERLDPQVRYPAVKTLNQLRTRYRQLRFDEKTIDAALIDETRSYYEILQILHVQRQARDAAAEELLKKALQERLDHNLELIFRLLGLRYPPKDMYSAYYGIVSSKKDTRASAIEFLDNVLGKNLKTYLLPFLDQVSTEAVVLKGQQLFGLRVESQEEALARLIRGRDSWLKACALYNIGGTDSQQLVKLAEEACNDPDPVVRETAQTILQSKKP